MCQFSEEIGPKKRFLTPFSQKNVNRMLVESNKPSGSLGEPLPL